MPNWHPVTAGLDYTESLSFVKLLTLLSLRVSLPLSRIREAIFRRSTKRDSIPAYPSLPTYPFTPNPFCQGVGELRPTKHWDYIAYNRAPVNDSIVFFSEELFKFPA